MTMDLLFGFACLCLVLALILMIKKRKAILATMKSMGGPKRFAYDLTEDERRIVRKLVELGEEDAAASVVSNYFEDDITQAEIRSILDTFRRQAPKPGRSPRS